MARKFLPEPFEPLDPETWETPRRMSLDEAHDQTGAARERNHGFPRDLAEEGDR